MDARKKVAVLLSGGVDSSVTAFLLKQQGYEVVAVTGKMFCSKAAQTVVENAKNVAQALDIEHYVCDVSDYFKENIIDYFENSYRNGETPNPCVVCNKKIKWGKIFDFAINKLNADFVATGHYANIQCENGIYKLFPARDVNKDQLYYLFELTQEQLSKTLFPLSRYEKPEIRKIAIENNLPSKSSKESQDICFIPKPMTTKKFLAEKFGEKIGNFIHKSTGQKLGVHNGAWQFTIGQRKGIGIAFAEPLYVVGVDVLNNVVFVDTKDKLFQDVCTVKELKFQSGLVFNDFKADVKIRYNMQKVGAYIKKSTCGFDIEFDEPVSAVTKGQALVVYDKNDGHLIAGGWL